MLVKEGFVFLLSVLSSSVIYSYENAQIDAIKELDNYLTEDDSKSDLIKPAVATTHYKHTKVFQSNGNVRNYDDLTLKLIQNIKKYALENKVNFCDLLPMVLRGLYQRKEIVCGHSASDPICNHQNDGHLMDYAPIQTPYYFDNKDSDALSPSPETNYSPTFPTLTHPDLNYQPGYYIYKPPPEIHIPLSHYQDFSPPGNVYKPANYFYQYPQRNPAKGKYKISPSPFSKPNRGDASSGDSKDGVGVPKSGDSKYGPNTPKSKIPYTGIPKEWEQYLPQIISLLNEDSQSSKPSQEIPSIPKEWEQYLPQIISLLNEISPSSKPSQASSFTTNEEKLPKVKTPIQHTHEGPHSDSVLAKNESVLLGNEKPKIEISHETPPERKSHHRSEITPFMSGGYGLQETYGTRKATNEHNNYPSMRTSQRRKGKHTLNYYGHYQKLLKQKQDLNATPGSRTIIDKSRKTSQEHEKGFSEQNRPGTYNNREHKIYSGPIYLNMSKPIKGEGGFSVYRNGADVALDNFLKENKGSILKNDTYYTISSNMGLPIGLKMFKYPFNETHIANKSISISLHPKPSELVKEKDISKINDVQFRISADGKVTPQPTFRSKAKRGIGGTTVAQFKPSGKTFIIKDNRLASCNGEISPETGECNRKLIPLVRHSVTDNCYINDFPRVADFVCLSSSPEPEPIYMTYYSNRLLCETNASNANFKTYDSFNRDCAEHATKATYKYYTNGPVDESANCTRGNPKVCTFEENLVLKEGSGNVLN
ncbi:uncharacterized protein LOC123011023 isoform X2 [Tribolium madens]|uniref:uncharacterized protein LOC123011023 isoform X2 n=1 Tax=Tribolium madens TaxID=41895 RepID=UPI001CF73440|nr:uncharacterized protein LOC123011023 isoform X2 [Tribolium madens]